MVFGLAHIHSRYVLHRDIKLDNVLLDEHWGVKICDFGVSKIMLDSVPIHEQCGTPAYIAPEIIEDYGYTGYYSDLWSLGIVLFSMLTASVPFKAKNLKELIDVLRTTPVTYPCKVSRSMYIKQNQRR
jgi:serine/threonine protein kinase